MQRYRYRDGKLASSETIFTEPKDGRYGTYILVTIPSVFIKIYNCVQLGIMFLVHLATLSSQSELQKTTPHSSCPVTNQDQN